jgi:hypothetical protein
MRPSTLPVCQLSRQGDLAGKGPEPADGKERTAVALTLVGILGWDRHDVGLQPAQQAVAYALRYAAVRLEEAGRPAPQALLQAIGAHRTGVGA